MPPKAGGVRFAQDWSWVGTEATSVDAITPQHRRRAAGLSGPSMPQACIYQLKRAHTVDSEETANDSDASVVLLKPKRQCTRKKCAGNPRCYNHMGGTQWLDADRKSFIAAHISDEVTVREGPAGLKNYGATCYANAFLQVWFHNVAFRNGVYDAVGTKQTALFHLASIFGMLQQTQRAVVDPGALIESLQLNKGNQQDAAEFSKLFMDLIEQEFTRAGAGTFIRDQFQGALEYRTRCDECGYTSTAESPFFELEISLKDKTSLESRIKHLLRAERLDGDNKYACRECGKHQPATRSTHLKSLPPVLYFSLMRFVYDMSNGQRKKVKAAITYPRVLSLNGDEYHLRGVVSHQGANATHGHFVCEVYNAADKEWYYCSDADVSKVEDRPKKRVKLDPNVEKEQQSRDAYMLVYKRATSPETAPQQVPEAILTAIEADNVALQTEIAERTTMEKTLVEDFDSLAAIKGEVLKALPGDDCIISTDALCEWLSSRDPSLELDLSPLCCQHGGVSPDATASIKLISRDAFNKLSKYTTIPELEVCGTCVEEEFTSRIERTTLAQQVDEFNNLNNDGTNGYVLPKDWLKDWRKGALGPNMLPTEAKYTLYCEHGKPSVDKRNRECVSSSSLMLLRSIFGDFEAFQTDAEDCETCAEGEEAAMQERLTWSATIREEKQIAKQLNLRLILDSTNYLLPRKFAEHWHEYRKRPGPRPEFELELCPHGKLDFDPQMEEADYLTQAGWDSLCRLYNHNPSDSITVIFTASPPKDKKECVKGVSTETCDECRRARLSDFDEMWLTVIRGRDSSPEVISATGRQTRGSARSRQWQVRVTKSSTVKYVHNQLYQMTKVSPLFQQLYLQGRKLEPEQTMEDIGLLRTDHLALEEIAEVVDLMDEDDGEQEGFGGTALVGRISCPQCTYSNRSGAARCEMCELPFTFE